MGIIIEFPADAAVRRLGLPASTLPRDGDATVLILPVVRIERHGDSDDDSGPKEGAAQGRRRRRRARS